MTVKVFISRNTDDSEVNFREPYERDAAVQIAKIFYRIYQPVKHKFYALIFNIQAPPADLIIISNDGLGVVDLKHIGDAVEGNVNSLWHIVDKIGNRTPIKNTHTNPARQVLDYRIEIEKNLVNFASQDKNLPLWMSKEQFFTQGAVLFTSEKFPLEGIVLGSYKQWLKLLWIDNTAEWAQTLSFEKSSSRTRLKLNNFQVEYIAQNFFKGSPWDEIAGFLNGKEPYGYLFLAEGGQRKIHIGLDTENVRIGRSRENDIQLPSICVSAKHCELSHTPEGTFIQDLDSDNGTWVNGVKLAQNKKHKIKSGDEIVLGPLINGTPHKEAVILTYMGTSGSKTTATEKYKAEE